MKKLTFLFALLAFVGFTAMAQTVQISGTVTSSEDGTAIPGVSVVVKGTTIGVTTDIDGNYTLAVPSNAEVLRYQFIGMKTQDVEIGGRTEIDVVMEPDLLKLDEVVVTGVASGTSTKKLGFAMSKVDDEMLESVPAVDASNTLRGKVAGVNVVQSQGDGDASVSLRGAKSIFGNISPLLIVDGILTNQSLGDINPNDIEKIEVIKGAAASSLYGSLAAGGVIQILTKRGREQSGIQVDLRAEYGISDLEKEYPVATTHPFLLNPDGSFDLSTGQRELDPDGNWSEFPEPLYDNIGRIMDAQPYENYFASISNSGDAYSFYGSAQWQSKGAIVKEIPSEERSVVRMNFDYYPNQKFTARISTSYQKDKDFPVSRNGQGTFFSTVLLVEPFINLQQKDEDGDYMIRPDGFEIQNANISNILYQYNNVQYVREEQRFVGGIDMKYQLTDNLSAAFSQSFDKSWYYSSTYYPVGYKTMTPSAALNNGNYSMSRSRSSYEVTSAQVSYARMFGDFAIGLVGKYLYEYQDYHYFSAGGRELTTRGVYDLGITTEDNRSMSSSQTERVTKNFFISADVDYRDKIIINGLIRRDGSSLFGDDARWQTFWRGSIAYRITEDFMINGMDELKARISYGSAGRRPTWSGQYETYSVSSSGIFAVNLGNKDLKPAVNKEYEIGIDGAFLNRFTFQANYAKSTVENDFIWRTLSQVTGYNQQYQNIGAVESSALEFQMGADVVRTSNFSYDANLTFDRVRSEITDLGGIPPFTNGIYRREEGQPVGVFYGHKVMTSVDDLETDENGYVTNAWNVGYNPDDMTTNYTKDQFSVNNLGYVVVTDDIGTADEQSIFYMDKTTGNKATVIIGDRNPDFKVGLANTFTFFKNLQLYFLLDWKQGGDKYNNTKQYMYFNYRHADQEEFAELGHHPNFAASASSIYDANNYCSAFVEDASYLKLRELSLSYTLRDLFNTLERVRFSLIGRNLLTFTKFESYDPEGYTEYFPYPVFRTITGSVQVSF